MKILMICVLLTMSYCDNTAKPAPGPEHDRTNLESAINEKLAPIACRKFRVTTITSQVGLTTVVIYGNGVALEQETYSQIYVNNYIISQTVIKANAWCRYKER